jgi:hypothetical protein
MSLPIRRETSTDCTISYWQAARKFGMGMPRSSIDRVVAVIKQTLGAGDAIDVTNREAAICWDGAA